MSTPLNRPGYPHEPASEAPIGYPDSLAQRPAPVDRGAQMRDWLDIVLRGKWLILAAVLIVVVPVAVYSYQQPSFYRSSSLLILDTGESMDVSEILPQQARAMGRRGRVVENEVFLIRQSLPLAERVATRLIEMGETPDGERLSIIGDGERAPSVGAVAGRLFGYISAGPEGRDLDALWISAVSTVPGEAALIANVYAEEYIRRTREVSRSRVVASRSFLEEQVERRSEELAAAEEAIRDFMSREGAVALDQESSNMVSQQAQLQAMRDETSIEIEMRQAQLEAVERELNQIQPRLAQQVASNVPASLERAQDQRVQLELRLEEIYLANPELRGAATVPPEVAELRRRLADTEREIAQLSARFVEEGTAAGGVTGREGGGGLTRVAELQREAITDRIALSGLQSQRNVINQRMGEYDRRLQQLPTQAMELARLQRDRRAVESLYIYLVERLQELRVTEEGELGYAEVIRPAYVPGVPFSPDRQRNVMMALFFGLGLGIALAVARRRLDHSIRRPDELREAGHVVLGVVPSMTKQVQEEFGGADTVEVDGRRYDTRLATLLDPLSGPSEAYRALRTNVQFSRPDTVIGSLLVTSASPEEGKSTTAANLSIVMAQAGRRVLLIDADLRRPKMHRLFGIPREPGLREALFGPVARDPEVVTSGIENLDLLPAGGSVPNPSELLGSKRMRELLERLRQEYDLVIFDAPPVQVATDPVLISTQCDATLLVVDAGGTKDYELEHALESLRSVGGQVIGLVLNRFDLSQTYGYKYKYRYRYSYQYGESN